MVTSGYGPRTAWQGCTLMVWSNNSQDTTGTPCYAHTSIVRAPHGNLQCFSYSTGPLRDPQGCRVTPLRARKGIDITRIDKKIPHGRRIWPTGARTGSARSLHGLFTGCLRSQNPYAARKLIMHALKLYGPLDRNSYIFIQENAFENAVWKMGGHFIWASMS